MSFPPALFITGTDTDVGKSVISAMLVTGLKAAYWKPVQSGLIPDTDTNWVRSVTGLPEAHFLPERHCFSQPLAPDQAAEIDKKTIALADFSLPETNGFKNLIVEGAGGLMVPLNPQALVIDLIAQLQLPVALVARSTLGTINHTLLSLAQLEQRNIPIWGVIMNGPANPANRRAIEHWGQVPVVAEVEPLQQINPQNLQSSFQKYFLQPS